MLKAHRRSNLRTTLWSSLPLVLEMEEDLHDGRPLFFHLPKRLEPELYLVADVWLAWLPVAVLAEALAYEEPEPLPPTVTTLTEPPYGDFVLTEVDFQGQLRPAQITLSVS